MPSHAVVRRTTAAGSKAWWVAARLSPLGISSELQRLILTIWSDDSLGITPLSQAAEVWRIRFCGPEGEIELLYFSHHIPQD